MPAPGSRCVNFELMRIDEFSSREISPLAHVDRSQSGGLQPRETVMSERSIFIAALEKDDPAERAAYLTHACAPMMRPYASGSNACSRRMNRPIVSWSAAPLFWMRPTITK